ncbi:MAG: 3-oxoadipate enol-lactonase [Geminicoccaceae bacterium]|nr:MAG: 3-oxoadipate enol-lactonase [Geminicoccaceae bacterium]
MATFELGPRDALAYEQVAPSAPGGLTFVFVNAITGDIGQWRAVGERLAAAGHGTLAWNFRGQAGSRFTPGTRLDLPLIVSDLRRLLDGLRPPRPVLVGLSIGGLYAARAILEGAEAKGLVLLNTLRKPGVRLDWINAAVVRVMEVAGPLLMRDLMTPLLFGPAWLAAHRAECLLPGTRYEPLDPASGQMELLRRMGEADWDVPWERLDLPTLVVSGLRDRVFYDARDVAGLAARLPRARRVDLPEAGHLLPVEAPEELASALLAFAREIAP